MSRKEKTIIGATPQQIMALDPFGLKRQLSVEEIEYIFTVCGAFWNHLLKEDPLAPVAPHVELTKGDHSDIYVNCPKVLQWTNLCQLMANQLVLRLREKYTGKVDWVTGSDSSALGISKDVANLLGARWHPMHKMEGGGQFWKRNAVIKPDEIVLPVEELSTSLGTSKEVRAGIRAAHKHPVKFAPVAPILVYRPKKKNIATSIEDSELLPVLYYETFVVDPDAEECLLCAQGSEALSAKDNWDALVESMLSIQQARGVN